MVTNEFGGLWKNLGAKALERKWSDHTSILLCDSWADFGPKPFKFFDERLKEESIEDVIKEAWAKEVTPNNPDCTFRDKLKNVKVALKKWSRDKMGEVDKELKAKKDETRKWET